MATDPGINAHIQMGRAWTSLQIFLSTWTVGKVNNLAALAAKARNIR